MTGLFFSSSSLSPPPPSRLPSTWPDGRPPDSTEKMPLVRAGFDFDLGIALIVRMPLLKDLFPMPTSKLHVDLKSLSWSPSLRKQVLYALWKIVRRVCTRI